MARDVDTTVPSTSESAIPVISPAKAGFRLHHRQHRSAAGATGKDRTTLEESSQVLGQGAGCRVAPARSRVIAL